MDGAPYRGGPEDSPASSPEETGLVADLIEQFADPLAFYRELVQNAIDAGSDSISVRVAWDDNVAAVSVRDSGTGMNRDVIEEQLLVLFRSGKEGREDAIGKFGVGFVSVLAVSPELVEVHTSLGDGTGHVVHLRPDQSWDLFETDGATTSGTTVTLRVPLAPDAYGQFIVDSELALERWCRHARVPIQYLALDHEGEILRDARVDRPLDLEGALVSVELHSGNTRAVVGLHPPNQTFCGFYNGGLTLWETSTPLAGTVSFKVQDPQLEHTLSRDNVRRDAAFKRVLRLIDGAVHSELGAKIIDALAEAAASDSARYRALLAVVDPDVITVPLARWAFPIISPIEGRSVVSGVDVAGLYSLARSPLTDALAVRGTPVIDAHGLDESEVEVLIALVARVTGEKRCRDAAAAYTLVEPVLLEGYDEVLLSRVGEILEDVARRPSSIQLARLSGACQFRFCIAGGVRSTPWLLTHEIEDDPLRLLARPPLVLNAEDALIAAARAAMEVEPELAATFVARAILLSTGRLDAKRDEALTARAIHDLLGSRG